MKNGNMRRALNSFLGTVYLAILITAFKTRGIDTFKFFCAYNWFGLMLIHYALAICGCQLYGKRWVQTVFAMAYGGAFTMSYIVGKYWEDALTNPEHFLAHYVPTVVTMIHVLSSGVYTFLETFIFQFVMFIIIRDPDSIYGFEFYDRYFDLLMCCLWPHALLEMASTVFQIGRPRAGASRCQ